MYIYIFASRRGSCSNSFPFLNAGRFDVRGIEWREGGNSPYLRVGVGPIRSMSPRRCGQHQPAETTAALPPASIAPLRTARGGPVAFGWPLGRGAAVLTRIEARGYVNKNVTRPPSGRRISTRSGITAPGVLHQCILLPRRSTTAPPAPRRDELQRRWRNATSFP